jgi:hypothetical protein
MLSLKTKTQKLKRNKNMVIAVDFDGTVVANNFPHIGMDIGAVPVLKRLVKNGHKLILSTMRCDHAADFVSAPVELEIHNNHGPYLQEAVDWFKRHDIPLYGVNKNPTQHLWTTSPKVYSHKLIDDTAIGIPLIVDPEEACPYVDWKALEVILENEGFFMLEKLQRP